MSYDVWVYVAARENSQMRVALMWVLDDTDSSKLTSKAHERRRKLISEVARTHYFNLQLSPLQLLDAVWVDCCVSSVCFVCHPRCILLPVHPCFSVRAAFLLSLLLLLLCSASFETPLLTIAFLLLSLLAANCCYCSLLTVAAVVLRSVVLCHGSRLWLLDVHLLGL